MRDYSDMLTMLDEAENGPTEDQLVDAPILDEYWFEPFPLYFPKEKIWVVAKGFVSGHPELNGMITTTPVIGFNIEDRWMRTRSRFYKLGDPIKFVKVGDDVFTFVGGIDPEDAQKILAVSRKRIRSHIQQVRYDDEA